MNHKSIVDYESGLEYRRRNHILYLLDDFHFFSLVDGDHDLALNGYCIDAPIFLPTGCMGKGHRRPAMQSIERGLTVSEMLSTPLAISFKEH